MATLGTTMVEMIFTLANSLPRRRLFPNDLSSLALLQMRICIWKTAFTHWSGEEHGGTIMETGTRTMWFGLMRELTGQSPKSNAVMLRSPNML